MKKHDLLKYVDDELLDKLFGFCYARTSSSYEAQDLCSDILFALVKTANTDGDIDSVYPFIWRVARNVYADFSSIRRQNADIFYEGDAEPLLCNIADEAEDNAEEILSYVYQRIAFLTRAYREVMIMFYIDGMSAAEIAELQGTSETAIRQRLFSARKKVRNEVEKMTDNYSFSNNKPVALDNIEYCIWGSGNPLWGDPKNTCRKQFSKHIIWLCRKKAMTAAEISEELNVPALYVEEELESLISGENGEYGLLKKLANGKYAVNFILLDADTIEKAQAVYSAEVPALCDTISEYIAQHKGEYLAFPYLNKKVDFNLILWQQIYRISMTFSDVVEEILEKKYFPDVVRTNRPFTVYGFVDTGANGLGGGWNSIEAENVCGYSKIRCDNISLSDKIKPHFFCGRNISTDPELQMAIRAIDGLDIISLSENEKEYAAKAVECGYLYREGDMLYTKVLVHDMKDSPRLFEISNGLRESYFSQTAERAAEKIAELHRASVPDYLLPDWEHFITLADTPVLDCIADSLIEKGMLTPPNDGVGAEGCWISVKK